MPILIVSPGSQGIFFILVQFGPGITDHFVREKDLLKASPFTIRVRVEQIEID